MVKDLIGANDVDAAKISTNARITFLYFGGAHGGVKMLADLCLVEVPD
jgi:hypothetical protein